MKKNSFIKHSANAITVYRILFAVCILAVQALSVEFYMLYTLCGITDILDGKIARSLNIESKFGALLDSAADIVFLLSVTLKLTHILAPLFSSWAILAVIFIACIRISAYAVAAIKLHKFIARHTIANKAAGLVLFLSVYFVFLKNIKPVAAIICFIAIISSIEELLINIFSKSYNPNIKSIFAINKKTV